MSSKDRSDQESAYLEFPMIFFMAAVCLFYASKLIIFITKYCLSIIEVCSRAILYLPNISLLTTEFTELLTHKINKRELFSGITVNSFYPRRNGCWRLSPMKIILT